MPKRTPEGSSHPVVAAFLYSDAPLVYILRNTPDPGDPLVRTMLTLRDSLSGNIPPEVALHAAQSTSAKVSDPNLYLMFLGMWAYVCSKLGRASETQVILNRAKALITKSTPLEFRAYFRYFESALTSAGNVVRRDSMCREALSLLPPTSPRYQALLLEYGEFLALLGRETEIDAEFEETQSTGFNLGGLTSRFEEAESRGFDLEGFQSRVALIRYVQCVETGRTAEAAQLVALFDSHSEVKRYYGERFEWYHALLRLMRDPWGVANFPERGSSLKVQILAALLRHDPSEALTLARQEVEHHPDVSSQLGFEAFNLVRAELASGNSESARRLLEMRHERGNCHYLDDFFYARVESLAGNRNAAARHFAATWKSIEQYQAAGRLDFELQLACELTPVRLLELARGSDKVYHESPPRAVRSRAAAPRQGIDRLIGRSAGLVAVRESVVRFAPLDAPVLITGETGTGKELVARALHEASGRRGNPFIAVNCGAISESLLESELFGHERGAFTGATSPHRGLFEEAGEGTIFLDEMGEITTRLQIILLRVLESGEIRPVGSSRTRKIACRILVATNANLESRAEEGLFRKDLLFRLRRLEIDLPPLRNRPEDVIPLAEHFLAEDSGAGPRATLSPELKAALLLHDWPGNARELRNTIERMRLTNLEKTFFGLEDLKLKRSETSPSQVVPAASTDNLVESTLPSHSAKTPRSPRLSLKKGEDVAAFIRDGDSRLRRLDRIRDLFRQFRTLRRIEIATILNATPHTVTSDLKALVSEGFIEKVTPTASPRTHYFILR